MNAACGGPKGERSESNLTYYVYVRFLRAVRVQTGCANNAWWDRLLIFILRNHISGQQSSHTSPQVIIH
ncbi:hypothetical protein EHH91_14180 [Salmonella enterica]|uniref:Uncharacterized protein n=6 Tax=Salmonella enterica I TaxID=59201 RepID=A0A5H9N460_SALPT|nr:hypothetical protein [Salmonella enterica]EAA9990460.1 hypothetical protein [Salmonella enterica subsp. enterica serovar Litchfield]EBH9706816.1 hypothetical protein [Salmonella enterica subsp. enterica serovar 4,[5],12:i:-]ECA2721285.1 hypothetical protein [Salmonella enterica subsp. enterica serovar Bovismorbificans]ECA8258303.1 hypothetical protein [Salmonella enterica subsp. enterica serovar Virchow]ECA9326540.1 hypothetical protein [Salmonella enterica subsp. enterica serovar Abony]EC